jgi:ATP-dependent RNA helicase DeaD
MNADDTRLGLGPALLAALERKGYDQLTPVQAAVLDPALAGRDLRITSQTGSGKTVAVGFVLRSLVAEVCPADKGIARPRALVVAPTRELARQFEEELAWLYADCAGRVASTTGGASYREERRALAGGPALIVGTPGRLLDHLERGAIVLDQLQAIVLDEADRMLDMGFREDIEAIFNKAPKERSTHLVSATFPHAVRSLADAVQRDAALVEGTRLGSANADIDHVIHLVPPREKMAAIINLLLATPDAQTLIFSRTRADVASIADQLVEAGFKASALSGEMDQTARNRALARFKRGDLHVLVATDVAARGIDVQDIARVIHAEPPTNADAYTHRSGRTGRAGRKGTSSLLVAPAAVVQATRVLRAAGVRHRFEPIPTAQDIRRGNDERVFAELTANEPEGSPTVDPRAAALAQRLAQHGDVTRTLERLLLRARYAGTAEPRELRPIAPPSSEPRQAMQRGQSPRGPSPSRGAAPSRGTAPSREPSHPREPSRPRESSQPRGASQPRPSGGFVPFRVSWGSKHGADPRKLLAVVCRRGGVRGSDVGAIRVEQSFSLVDIASGAAEAFAQSASEPDPRNPRVAITPDRGPGPQRARAVGDRPAPSRGHAPLPSRQQTDDGPSPAPSRRGDAPPKRRR